MEWLSGIYIHQSENDYAVAQLLSNRRPVRGGLDATVVDRAIDRLRIGWPFVQRRRHARLLTPKGAFLIAADHLIARDIAARRARSCASAAAR